MLIRSFAMAAALMLIVGCPIPAPADEPQPARVRLLGPSLQQPPADKPIVIAAGRFCALGSPDKSENYLAPQSAFRVYEIKPGGYFAGIKWDAEANGEPEAYEWPDVKTPVLVVLARDVPGTYSLQLVKNGPPGKRPVVNGPPFAIQIVSGLGPRPPPPDPDPKPDPIPDPKPPPVTDRQLGLIVFSDKETRTPETAKLLMSRYWQTLSERHRVATYLRSTNERVGKAFLAEIGNMTGDVLLIRDDAKSAKLEAIPLPKGEAEFAAAIRAWSSR